MSLLGTSRHLMRCSGLVAFAGEGDVAGMMMPNLKPVDCRRDEKQLAGCLPPRQFVMPFGQRQKHALTPSSPVILFAELCRGLFRALALLSAIVETLVCGPPLETPRTVCPTVLRKGA